MARPKENDDSRHSEPLGVCCVRLAEPRKTIASKLVPVPALVPVPVSLLNLVPILAHGSHRGFLHTVSNIGETMKNMGGTRSASNSGSKG